VGLSFYSLRCVGSDVFAAQHPLSYYSLSLISTENPLSRLSIRFRVASKGNGSSITKKSPEGAKGPYPGGSYEKLVIAALNRAVRSFNPKSPPLIRLVKAGISPRSAI
jgi:hypothetical protein